MCNSQALYAANGQGVVKVLRVVINQGKLSCRVVGQMQDAALPTGSGVQGVQPPDHALALTKPLRFVTTPGYLLAASPGELFVFNTTRMHQGRQGFSNRLAFARPHTGDEDVCTR